MFQIVGITGCGSAAGADANLFAGATVRCIRLMDGAKRRTENGWQSAARWRGAKRPRHHYILPQITI